MLRLQTGARQGFSRASVIGLVVFGLVGCATTPPTPIDTTVPANGLVRFQTLRNLNHFSIEAKLAVQYSGKGYTARITWEHEVSGDHLRIYNPLGQQIATIDRTASSVTLIDQHGQAHVASDVGSLTESLLGWHLPITGLSQWILGMPHDHSPFEAHYLDTGTPAAIIQDQWKINYDDYRETQIDHIQAALPYTTKLQQNDIRLKLIIMHW